MSTALLLMTHSSVGKALFDTAATMFNDLLPVPVTLLPVPLDSDPEKILEQAVQTVKTHLQQVNLNNPDDNQQNNGILVLTDAFGSTPNNIAQKLLNITELKNKVSVVSGINLPMLIRVFNYPNKSHGELANYAVEAGRQGVIQCQK